VFANKMLNNVLTGYDSPALSHAIHLKPLEKERLVPDCNVQTICSVAKCCGKIRRIRTLPIFYTVTNIDKRKCFNAEAGTFLHTLVHNPQLFVSIKCVTEQKTLELLRKDRCFDDKKKKEGNDDKKTAKEKQFIRELDKRHAQEDERCIRCWDSECGPCDPVMDRLLFICNYMVPPLSSPNPPDAKYRDNSKVNKYAVCGNPRWAGI